jgi:putative FmdB family regulatory protein
MPVYQYSCTCGRMFETVKSMKESDDPETCPDCGLHMERVITPITVVVPVPTSEARKGRGRG